MQLIKLFPHYFKTIGLILFVASLVPSIYGFTTDFEPGFFELPVLKVANTELLSNNQSFQLFSVQTENVFNEVCLSLLLIGGLFVLLAKEKDEDELINKIRLESMLWSAKVNGIFLLMANFLFYGFTFYYVLIINLFLLFILYIIKFQWSLHKLKRAAYD